MTNRRMLAAAVAVCAFSSTGYAQQLEEVLVTAQKRTESVQDVPISIVAMTGDSLEKAQIVSADELGRVVPNLSINRQAQSSSVSFRMRGVGAAGNNAIDPSVAPFIDGVYIARGGAVLSSFLDVASVEVLRGPQGTLFGRNATTGALQINTHKPEFDEVSGEVYGEYGEYDAYRVRGIVNVPVSDTFALRAAALMDKHDGYYDNKLDGKEYGDRDNLTTRLSARWQPSDNLDWVLRYDYAEQNGDGSLPAEVSSHQGPTKFINAIGSAFGPLSPDISDPFDGTVSQKMYAEQDDTQWGISSDLNWDLESGYRIRWIAAWRDWENEQLDGDVVFTGLDLVNRFGFYDSSSMSQEVQVISPERGLFNNTMDYVAGFYYFEEDYKLGEDLNLGVNFCPVLVGPVNPALIPVCQSLAQTDAAVQTFDQEAESYAAFLETNWALTDSLKLTLGGRYTKDDKQSDYLQLMANPFAAALRRPEANSLDFDDDQFTYRIVLSWYATEDMMLFANYSTGYKSGGINSQGSATPLNESRLFDSESVKDIELGIKSTLMDGGLQLNATAYRMEIEDFQDRSFRDASFIITNAGTLVQQGVEAEIKAMLTDDLTLDVALAYLDSEFDDFEGASPLAGCAVLPVPGTPSCPNPQDNTGKTGTYSPEWEFNVALDYSTDISSEFTFNANANWQYVDDHIAGGTELSSQTVTDSYDLLDARMSIGSVDGTWELSVFGKNLTDERYALAHFTQVLGASLGLVDTTSGDTVYRHYVSAPRTWGVGLQYRF